MIRLQYTCQVMAEQQGVCSKVTDLNSGPAKYDVELQKAKCFSITYASSCIALALCIGIGTEMTPLTCYVLHCFREYQDNEKY